MEWNGLWGLLYGAICGLFEFLPASPQAHEALLLKVFGLSAPGYGMRFAVHFGALIAVCLAYFGKLGKLTKEKKIASIPLRKRKRNPDMTSLLELRHLKTAALPLVLSCLIGPWLSQYVDRLWVLVALVILNGILVLIPQYLMRANKNARGMSPLDALLTGFGGVIGAVPGFSRIGGLTSVGSVRGLDLQFCLTFVYLLSIPALAALCVGDLVMLIVCGTAATTTFLQGVLAWLGAAMAGFGGIQLMRFLSYKNGFGGFAYYNFGLAMLILILYLIG